MRTILYLLVVVLTTHTALLSKILHVPADYATIQLAVNAASVGDTVLVAEGTYKENLVIMKNIVLASLFLTDRNSAHISNTIIDGSSPLHPDTASVIRFEGSGDTTTILIGFTITGGGGTVALGTLGYWKVGGGVRVRSTGGVKIINNIFRNNIITNTATVTQTEGAGRYY